jgi:hypothetical protein
MPSPSWDALVRQNNAVSRRRKRRRRQQLMLWLLTCVTTAVLVVIYLLVRDISGPSTAAPAALSSPAQAARLARVVDAGSGLSYQLLPSPWRQGCPATLKTPTFSWSAGEDVVAGQVVTGGSSIDWYANACSGPLQRQFHYSGAADLKPTAVNLVGALDPAYYAGLVHHRTIERSSAMRVSGHQAWMVSFLMNYPDAAAEGLHWKTELGAVVVVDRGTRDAPAVFYVSVPANLGTSKVTVLIDSLRLSPPP